MCSLSLVIMITISHTKRMATPLKLFYSVFHMAHGNAFGFPRWLQSQRFLKAFGKIKKYVICLVCLPALFIFVCLDSSVVVVGVIPVVMHHSSLSICKAAVDWLTMYVVILLCYIYFFFSVTYSFRISPSFAGMHAFTWLADFLHSFLTVP